MSIQCQLSACLECILVCIKEFPKEIFKASQRWVETRFKDLRYFNVLDTGGHFAAFEQPELYVQEVRACFQKMS